MLNLVWRILIRKYRFLCFILCIFSALILVRLSRIGIGFADEGATVIPIYGFHSGLLPYIDFVEYKGFLFPLLVSKLLPGNLLNIANTRLLYVLLATCCALLLAQILISLNFHIFSFVSFLWLILIPTTSLTYSRPYPAQVWIEPNIFITFLLLLSIYGSTWGMRNWSKGVGKFAIIFAGITSGMAMFVRVQSIAFILLSFVVFFTFSFTKKTSPLASWTYLISCLTSISVFIVGLIKMGALNTWFRAIFISPLYMIADGSGATNAPFIQIIGTIKTFTWMTVLFLLITSASILIRNYSIYVLFLVEVISLILTQVFALSHDVNSNLDNSIMNWVTLTTQWLPFAPLYASAFISIIFLVLAIFRVTIKASNYEVSRPNVFSDSFGFDLSMSLVAALSCITLLYPNAGNLWSISPILILSTLQIVRLIFRKYWDVIYPSIWLQIAAWAVLGVILAIYVNSQTYSEVKNGIYKGVKVNNESTANDLFLVQHLVRQVPIEEKFLNDCPIWTASVLNGHYQSAETRWSTFGNMRYFNTSRVSYEYKLTCVLASEEPNNFVPQVGWQLVDMAHLSNETSIYLIKKSGV